MNRFARTSLAFIITSCGLSLSAGAQPDTKPGKPASDQPAKDPAPATSTAPRNPDAKASAPKPPEYTGKRLIVGEPAPALSIEKWVKGEPITGFEKGKVYIVEFWATWCPQCKEAIPHLNALQKEYKDKGLTIIAVASPAWRDELAKVEEMVKANPSGMGYAIAWDKPIPTDDKDVNGKPVVLGATNNLYMQATRQARIPRAFVVDAKGVFVWLGNPGDLDLVLDDVVAGKWDVKDSPGRIEDMRAEARKLIDNIDADPKGSLKAFDAFETKYPRMIPRLASVKYELLMSQGMCLEAFKIGPMVVDQAFAHKDHLALNTLSWVIVDPEGKLSAKDRQAGADLALLAATKAAELTQEKDAAILDTLARCYWVKGNKPKAVELQKRAVAALGKDEDELRSQLTDTLKEYEGGAN